VDQGKRPRKEVSEEKLELQSRLPALGDDAEVGVQKEHLVARDGKADLSFTGTLLASAAPASAPQGRWQEYRIYETNGGKHVFSKITRNVSADQQDTHEADVFDPAPSTVPSKLLRSARDLAHSHPLTWMDAAVGFFGYDPLANFSQRVAALLCTVTDGGGHAGRLSYRPCACRTWRLHPSLRGQTRPVIPMPGRVALGRPPAWPPRVFFSLGPGASGPH
jgi:hypothetical protein